MEDLKKLLKRNDVLIFTDWRNYDRAIKTNIKDLSEIDVYGNNEGIKEFCYIGNSMDDVNEKKRNWWKDIHVKCIFLDFGDFLKLHSN